MSEYPVRSIIVIMILFTMLASTTYLSLASAAYASADSRLVSDTSFEGADLRVEVTGPIKLDEPNQVFPYLANGTDYTFNISFLQPNSTKPLTDVNYNIVIANVPEPSPGDELFNAAKQANSSNNMLHSANGNATIKYNFKEIRTAELIVHFYGTNSAPSNNQQHEFTYQIVDSKTIPEFPLSAIGAMAAVIGVVILVGRMQKNRGAL